MPDGVSGSRARGQNLTCWMVGSPARLVSRLRMLRSDIWRRAATGGMRDSMEGRRVTSAFMSLSSSSSWFKTVEEGYRRGDAVTQVAPAGAYLQGCVTALSRQQTPGGAPHRARDATWAKNGVSQRTSPRRLRAAEMRARNSRPTLAFPPGPQPASQLPGRHAAPAHYWGQDGGLTGRDASGNISHTEQSQGGQGGPPPTSLGAS